MNVIEPAHSNFDWSRKIGGQVASVENKAYPIRLKPVYNTFMPVAAVAGRFFLEVLETCQTIHVEPASHDVIDVRFLGKELREEEDHAHWFRCQYERSGLSGSETA